MRIYKWLKFIFLSLFIFLSCSAPKEKLTDFDFEGWKADENACKQTREKLAETLIKQKGKLLSLNEMQIVKELGKPDLEEIYKRNEKFFYYFIEPAPSCPNGSASARRLAIRFNAVGLAKEINTE